MKEWHFNVLFFVGVGGAILMLLGPELGLHIEKNATAVTGMGAILTYVLTKKDSIVKPHDEENAPKHKDKSK
jgi:hypothetical protein